MLHLEQEHLYKLGLCYFFQKDGNTDIATAYEIGPSVFPDVPSFQIDRGRLENFLHNLCVESGIKIIDNCNVKSIKLSGVDLSPMSQHETTFLHDKQEKVVKSD